MIVSSAPVRTVLIALAACLLAGCISILPKEKASQLYTFGAATAAVQTPVQPPARFMVALAPLDFARPAASDRILTTDGAQVAYLGGARWVSAANSLFESAVVNAFDANGGAARLLARGEAGRAAYILKLDVRAFDVRYDHGPAAPPTIAIELYAALNAADNHAPVAEHIFSATIPASDNRVGAIVGAFSQAVTQVLTALTAWVDHKGAA